MAPEERRTLPGAAGAAVRGAVARIPGARALRAGGRGTKPGQSPGTLTYVGEPAAGPVRITLIDYDEAHVEEREVRAIEEVFTFRDTASVTWVNVDGLHDVDLIARLGKHYGIHPLVLEDLLNTHQRPKAEDYGDYLFLVLKMLRRDPQGHVAVEQVSLILGKSFVFSFQERPGDVFDPVRERIRGGRGHLRRSGADYLAYALVDTVVDNYFLLLEGLSDRLEALEEELLAEPTEATMRGIHELKRQAIVLRRSVWPLREVVGTLERGDSPLVKRATRVFLRDVYDHTVQAMDTIESMRELLAGMHDLYLSSASNRMNEIMKVLTIIATVFIPLTFLAGVYGMNFQHMPELAHPLAYPLLLLLMLGIALVMAGYFRRKGWL